mgnify:CR=1 FL=1
MYISKISLRHIKSIQQLELDLPPTAGWHVLLGDNGTGKSTILQAISLSLIGVPDLYLLRENWNHWLKKGQNLGYIQAEVETQNEYDWGRSGRVGQDQKISTELVFVNTKSRKNPEEDRVVFKYKAEPAGYLEEDFVGWFSAAYGAFRRFQSGEDRQYQEIAAAAQSDRLLAHVTLFKAEVTLRQGVSWLQELDYLASKGQEGSIKLDTIIQFINTSQLLPAEWTIKEIGPQGIDLQNPAGLVLSIQELSDGYLSMLSLVLELIRQLVSSYAIRFQFQTTESGQLYIDLSGVILIDEVDVHLHPSWQVQIGEWFTRYFPNIQFIVSTHSPLICQSATSGSIWKIERPDSGQASGRVTEAEYNRLVYGNVLEALGTELFGQQIARSSDSADRLDRLATLNMKKSLGQLSPAEEEELAILRRNHTTDDTFEL